MKKLKLLIIPLLFLLTIPFIGIKAKQQSTYNKIDLKSSDGVNYYSAVGEQEIKQAFDFKIRDLANLDKILGFITDNTTYVTIRQANDHQPQVFWNTPNLSQLAKNIVYGYWPDGFVDNPYNPYEQPSFVELDPNDQSLVNQLGFKIPSYTYRGEYPKVIMSVNNIIPTGFFDGLVKSFKSFFFGYSFIEAPKQENYNSIQYRNHTYSDIKDESIVNFIKDYWQPYFIEPLLNNRILVRGSYQEEVKHDTDYTEDHPRFGKVHVSYKETDIYKNDEKSLLEKAEPFKDKDQGVGLSYLNSVKTTRQSFESARDWLIENKYVPLLVEAKQDLAEKEIEEYDKNVASIVEHYSKEQDICKEKSSGDCSIYDRQRDKAIENLGPRPEEYEPTDFEKNILNQWSKKEKTINNYVEFMGIMENDLRHYANGDSAISIIPLKEITTAHSTQNIGWSTCLIENTGEKGECLNDRYKEFYNEPVKLSMLEVFSPDMFKKNELKTGDAYKIIVQIQKSTGMYYSEVMNSIISMMKSQAKMRGVNISPEEVDNYRVMPYDISTMSKIDKQNVGIADKRVIQSDIYNFLGLNLPHFILSKEGVASGFLNFIGAMSGLCVWISKLITLDVFDNLDLQPHVFWTSNVVGLLSTLLIFGYLLKLIPQGAKIVIGSGSKLVFLGKEILNLLVITCIISIMLSISSAPKDSWLNIKSKLDKITMLGEDITLKLADIDTDYLIGKDSKNIYWVPYFNAWSVYNTGYNINEKNNLINYNDGTPETRDLENKAKYWPELLAKSFKGEDHKISNDAYRVVDHYLAPRVEVNCGNNCTLSIDVNENDNNSFQNLSFNNIVQLFSVLVSFLTLLLIVIVKAGVITQLWYEAYFLIFNLVYNIWKGTGEIISSLKRALTPILTLLLVGLYGGVVMNSTLVATGVGGLVFNFALLFITLILIVEWRNRYLYSFPIVLKPIYNLATFILKLIGR